MEAFSEAKPVDHLKEIVLYGGQKISLEKLDAWIKTNLFYVEIKVKYTKEWDEGTEVTFKDIIVEYVQKERPMKLVGFYAPDATMWKN